MYIYSFLVDVMLASLQQLLENLLERSTKETVPWQVTFALVPIIAPSYFDQFSPSFYACVTVRMVLEACFWESPCPLVHLWMQASHKFVSMIFYQIYHFGAVGDKHELIGFCG